MPFDAKAILSSLGEDAIATLAERAGVHPDVAKVGAGALLEYSSPGDSPAEAVQKASAASGVSADVLSALYEPVMDLAKEKASGMVGDALSNVAASLPGGLGKLAGGLFGKKG